MRDRLVNSSVLLRRDRALTQGFLSGRCQTACSKSNRTVRGIAYNTSASREFTILIVWTEQSGMRERLGAQRVSENPPENLIGGEASRVHDVDEWTF